MSLFVLFGLGAVLLACRLSLRFFVRTNNLREVLIWIAALAVGIAAAYGALRFWHPRDHVAQTYWFISGGIGLVAPEIGNMLRDAAQRNSSRIVMALAALVGALILLGLWSTHPEFASQVTQFSVLIVMGLIGYSIICGWRPFTKK
jgi:lysylphosphatidylglycerol synthetase-like protein (DUF2156 family)